MFRFFGETPVDDGAICFDVGEVDGGDGGDFEAEEAGEFVEGFVEDLGCAVD